MRDKKLIHILVSLWQQLKPDQLFQPISTSTILSLEGTPSCGTVLSVPPEPTPCLTDFMAALPAEFPPAHWGTIYGEESLHRGMTQRPVYRDPVGPRGHMKNMLLTGPKEDTKSVGFSQYWCGTFSYLWQPGAL